MRLDRRSPVTGAGLGAADSAFAFLGVEVLVEEGAESVADAEAFLVALYEVLDVVRR